MKQLLFILIVLMALMSCGSSPDVNNPGKAIGKIELTPANTSLAKQVASNYNTETMEFGTVRASESMYAIWNNIGDAPITDIKITTNNEQLLVKPSNIAYLEVGGKSSVLYLSEFHLVHGLDRSTGDLIKPLLPYGRGVYEIYFEGVSNGEVIRDTFTVGYQAIYINLTATVDGPHVATMGFESEFEGEHCTANKLGTTLSSLTDTVMLGQSWIDSHTPEVQWSVTVSGPDAWQADCVISNHLPWNKPKV
jgi:hypothetical protein